jgi:hypothetical protein
MENAGVFDFSIQDILNPQKDRVRTLLSGLINYAKFREDRGQKYYALQEHSVIPRQ